MIHITIPSFQKVEDENGSYTVFCIEISVAGKFHELEKRYTEFEVLHKKLKKQKIQVPEFPPKKVLKFNHKILEHRRQGLETYLQGVLANEKIPKSVISFLQVKLPDNNYGSFESLENLDEELKLNHQPVIAFTSDPFLQDPPTGTLPDIINQGVNMGLYGSMEDIT
ncbi:sorting nexin-24 [Lingula anatina]|uniref:Sorting nexin-24 n=1 Tax=Lingula anatina TaxID=7574 RepID=A0A1S3I977_LINAN|nr:sorting nexin-24 [Lingula anatina]|eukprot:XP_013394743.1 sorting nexin-24 [Lingula anatina]